MGDTGAGAVGWPIVWSLPLFPLRAASSLGYHSAYYLGIAILLACNVVTDRRDGDRRAAPPARPHSRCSRRRSSSSGRS